MTYLLRVLLALVLVTGTSLGGTSVRADHSGPHIYVRKGALCRPWSDVNLHMVWTAGIVHFEVGLPGELEVTSCRSDSPHRVPTTLHPEDKAADVTWKGYNPQDGIHVADHLRQELGMGFDIVVYDHHLHMEYDP